MCIVSFDMTDLQVAVKIGAFDRSKYRNISHTVTLFNRYHEVKPWCMVLRQLKVDIQDRVTSV